MQIPEITAFLKIKCPLRIVRCPLRIVKCPLRIVKCPLILTKDQLYYILYFEVISMQNKNKSLAERKVIKSNAIIQNARFELTLQEQKIIAYICSKVTPNNKDTSITINVSEFIEICGIQSQGKVYQRVKAVVNGLTDRKMWVEIEPNVEVTMRWVQRAWINKNNGQIKLELDELMKPYLYDLKQRFTQYQLKNVLKMKSRYAVQLFELFKSYEYRKIFTVSVDRLKKLLMVDNIGTYENFGKFREKVLTVAINEINRCSDITISYEVSGKEVRKVSELTFFIEHKDNQKSKTTNKTDEPNRSYDMSILDGIGLLD